MKVKKGLIQTVGLTEGPIVASLKEHRPDMAVFLASQDSIQFVERALAEVPLPKHKALLIQDPEEMEEVFSAARRAYRLLKGAGVEEYLADPTGGTKTMAAGLSLALAGLGFTFVYVGGSRRGQDGRVIRGHERVRTLADPTERFHVFERRAFMRAWNGWRMRSAVEIMDRILEDQELMESSERTYYEALRNIAWGMFEWDRFHHTEAYKLLKDALPDAIEIAETWDHRGTLRLLRALEERLQELDQVRRAVQSGHSTFAVLADLLANAERRAEAGRYDDALARLYRAVELAIEAHFNEHYNGMHLKNPKTWPKALDIRKDLKLRASDLYGLSAVLDLAMDLAIALGEKGSLPQNLFAQQDRLLSLTRERNRSILAHGVEAVEEKDYLALRDFLAGFGLKAAKPWPRWRT